MRFYDRQNELAELERIRRVAFNSSSQMTIVTGRRRIGKTKLILESCKDTPTVYLFVGRSSETSLCIQFAQQIRQSLSVFIPEGISSFKDVFGLCMEIGKSLPFNLVIDEFQEFLGINQSVFGQIQDIWDRNKDSSRVNLIISGSVYSLMHKIFEDYKEPLYGRATGVIKLKPFSPSVLKTVLADFNPSYNNDDLLALYCTTGGVPKYVEMLMESGAYNVKSILSRMCSANSVFLEEGNILLVQEIGKQYGTYFSVLSAIASGANEVSRISQLTGIKSIGGILQRLEEDYDIISKSRPILSKPGSQTVRYVIKDHFLRFWFRYIVKNQYLVQAGQFDRLTDLVVKDYSTFSGKELESYFKDKVGEEMQFDEVGSWWEGKRLGGGRQEQYELDIVCINTLNRRVLIVEVKRDKKNFQKQRFEEKVEQVRAKYFNNYDIQTVCWGISDM